MAKIYGIELKNIKTGEGMEGMSLIGSLYLDGKRVGKYKDYGDGAYGTYEGDREKEVNERIAQYFRENPQEDFMKLYAMDVTPEDYVKMKKDGTMPYTQEPSLDIFIDDLFNLSNTEKGWKKAQKQGYPCFVTVRFVSLPNTPCPIDYDYSCKDDAETIERIKAEADKKCLANIVTVYRTEEDFIINSPKTA